MQCDGTVQQTDGATGRIVQQDERCNGMNNAMGRAVQRDEWCNGTSGAMGRAVQRESAVQRDERCNGNQRCNGNERCNGPGIAPKEHCKAWVIATRVATIHRSVATNVAMGVAMLGHRERRTKLLR